MFKIGDKVTIRKDLYVNIDMKLGVTPAMVKYAGKETEIIKVNEIHSVYYLAIDHGTWCWSEEMFESKPFTKADLKDGMICTIRKGWEYIKFNDYLCNNKGHIDIADLNDDLTLKKEYNATRYDIIQVVYNGEVVFEREETSYHQQLMKFEKCFRKYRERLRINKKYRDEELAKKSLEEAIKLCKEIEVE